MKCGININYCYLYRHVENNLPRSDNNFANNRDSSYNCSFIVASARCTGRKLRFQIFMEHVMHSTSALKNISRKFHFGKGDGLARGAKIKSSAEEHMCVALMLKEKHSGALITGL